MIAQHKVPPPHGRHGWKAVRNTVGAIVALTAIGAAVTRPATALHACTDTGAQVFQALFDEMEAVKEARRYDQVPDFWDLNDPAPLYVAEEEEKIFTDWHDIKAYWSATNSGAGWVDLDYEVLTVKCLSDDDALVLFNLRWDMALDSFPKPLGGDNRALAGFRRTDAGWKLHTWVEAPLAALIYMRKLYEVNVRPEALAKAEGTGLD